MQDHGTQCVCRLPGLTNARLNRPKVAHIGAGKVNNAYKLFLVIDSVRSNTKPARCSTAHVPPDGAGGSAMG